MSIFSYKGHVFALASAMLGGRRIESKETKNRSTGLATFSHGNHHNLSDEIGQAYRHFDSTWSTPSDFTKHNNR